MGLASALTEAMASETEILDEGKAQAHILKKLGTGMTGGGWKPLSDVAKGYLGHFKDVQKAAEVLAKKKKVQTKTDPREGLMLKLAEEAQDLDALFAGAADDLDKPAGEQQQSQQ